MTDVPSGRERREVAALMRSVPQTGESGRHVRDVIEVNEKKISEGVSIDQAETVDNSRDHGPPAKTIRQFAVLRALGLDWPLFLILRMLILFFTMTVMTTGCSCRFLSGCRFRLRSSTRSQTHIPTRKIGAYYRQEGH